jgi:hypothetical protein
MIVVWLFVVVGMVYLCRKEYIAEKREFEQSIGIPKDQAFKAYKHMRGENITFRDIIQQSFYN